MFIGDEIYPIILTAFLLLRFNRFQPIILDMDQKPKDIILLTGAGFSRNFGGFLAREMWSKIFNNPLVQGVSEVRDLLLEDFDFESVYSTVLIGGRYSVDAKNALTQAIEQAYKDLDDTVKNWVFKNDNPIAFNTYGFGEIVSLMSQRGSESGWFFTLNQDLLMERKNGFRSPGAAFGTTFVDKAEGGGIQVITMPNEQQLEKAKATLNNSSYIKLHGSYGWTSSHGGTQMVIGRNKTEDIGREPLLNWYFELFKNAIYAGSKKMLIIGYGFGDAHINAVLLKGVQEHGLSLYIINPTDPQTFKNRLEGRPEHFGSYEISKYFPIWKGVKGYFPYSFREIYPPDQSETTVAKELKRIITD